MIDFNNVVSTIRDNNGFVSNDYDDSFYRVYKTSKGAVQVRVSNHGTHLCTWVENTTVNPSQCIANICIVLSEDGKHDSSVQVAENKYRNNNSPDGEPYDFEVTQYVYNCAMLSKKDAAIINKSVMEIPQKVTFIDTLKTDSNKHACVFRLKPNQPIETLMDQCCVGVGPKQMIPRNIVG